MTSKELLYVEDALGHENFMKLCSKKTSEALTDNTLSTSVRELEQNILDYLKGWYKTETVEQTKIDTAKQKYQNI